MKKLLLILLFSSLPFTKLHLQQASVWDQVPEEKRRTEAFQRFEWYYKQIAYPSDTIPVFKYRYERNNEIQKIKNQERIILQVSGLPLT